jgi:hypothetical protein
MHRLHTRHGVNVIYSDRSVFAGLPVLQALHRDEVVGMQIDPWGQLQDAQGRPREVGRDGCAAAEPLSAISLRRFLSARPTALKRRPVALFFAAPLS